MTIRELEVALLERIRVWWRPVTCVGIAVAVFVNAIVLPLMRTEPISLTDLAATIASCATIFAVREWGKINGAD
jgi:uncharacterized membrane protein YagU involved in acid resistance